MSAILILSVLLRLGAVAWSLVLVRRTRDWRALALVLMLGLMATRQVLVLIDSHRSWRLAWGDQASELPALAVSVLALVFLATLHRMLDQRDQTEASRRAEAERNRALLERDRDLRAEVRADGKIVYANARFLRTLGYDAETLHESELPGLLHPDGRQQAELRLARQLAGGDPEPVVHRMQHRDGSSRWLEVGAEVFEGAVGERRVMLRARDVTEAEHAPAALRESQQRYQLVADHSRDIVWSLDLERRITYVSPSVRRVLGFTPEEQRARMASFHMLTPESARHARELWQHAVERGLSEYRFEAEHWTRDGGTIWCEVQQVLVRDESGAVRSVIGVTRDISERKRLEAESNQLELELRQAQRMEAFAQLAGGVAHDFNNYLTVILGHAEQLRSAAGSDADACESLEAILEAAERSSALTGQLLAFSRKQVLEPRGLDLAELVRRMEPLLRRAVGEHVRLVLDLAGPAPVHADATQLEQVVVNLALNARDAMLEGGELRIEVAVRGADARAGTASQEDCVELVVRDTGSGMDDETRARIFEPFFTTKPEGRGIGLGLSTVYGIVRQSGGAVEVSSRPGQGSVFRVRLPRTDAVVGEASTRPEPVVAGGTETILLVEDEALVRRFLRRTLAQRGYRVLDADDGELALAVASDHDGSIDLLLTDVRMPRLGGPRLSERLRADRPELRLLFISGQTDGLDPDALASDLEVRLLRKPFTAEKLLREVRRALDADRPRAPRDGAWDS